MTYSTPINKGKGQTLSEIFLGKLCQHAFLSLWSYPNVYRAPQKELCDLLVVFGNQLIVFSDKFSPFQVDKSLDVAWARWFDRSVESSAQQAWRAVRWIEQYPQRLYLDRPCTQPLPFDLSGKPLTIRIVVVAHGSAHAVRKYFGDSGSLMLDSSLKGLKAHKQPFYVGDLEPSKPFVHVLDDETLLAVVRNRDTITDFIHYLDKRERLFRGRTIISTTGEEELLAIYLTKLNSKNEHDFVFPVNSDEPVAGIFLDQGYWEQFQTSKKRVEQLKRDKISYLWDTLIERFAEHALQGTQYLVSAGGFHDSERILRFMANEPRVVRRAYSESLENMFETTEANIRRIRVLSPLIPEHPYYVVLLMPVPRSLPYAEYRDVRQKLLYICCQIVKLKFPDVLDVVGIAMEPSKDSNGGSEDACYFDARHWTAELENEVRELQKDLQILQDPKMHHANVQEYPEVPPDEPSIQ